MKWVIFRCRSDLSVSALADISVGWSSFRTCTAALNFSTHFLTEVPVEVQMSEQRLGPSTESQRLGAFLRVHSPELGGEFPVMWLFKADYFLLFTACEKGKLCRVCEPDSPEIVHNVCMEMGYICIFQVVSWRPVWSYGNICLQLLLPAQRLHPGSDDKLIPKSDR